MLERLRAMPPGVLVFLGYAFLVLGAVGLSLRFVVDQAISAPLSPVGVVVMVLLAYTIFTVTLVLQRKEASRNLALGLSSLTIPAVPLLALGGCRCRPSSSRSWRSCCSAASTRPAVRAYLSEP